MSSLTKKVYSGFDSAWSDNNRGACTSIIVSDGEFTFDGPHSVSFQNALEHLKRYNEPSAYHLVAVDQPIIVPNMTSNRPVERAVSHLVGLCGGGVQPSNRGKADMFGDDAPIWKFLAQLGGDINPMHSLEKAEGFFVIEVFPALGNLGLFEKYFDRRRMPKYNPDRRKTFNTDDWKDICTETADLFSNLNIHAGRDWCERASALTGPSKEDQDKLDSILCALNALRWADKGLSASIVIGDMDKGYMVVPSGKEMSRVLNSDALRDGVPVRSNIDTA